ncbi:HNH endonuclease [Pectobacterium phage vB_PatP_CB5]|uniref:HNH endonuclease n=1 Tax=Pectobacterium phage vB_PatP_CB5 TaxID=1983582 RepID=A0A2U7MVT7_9CAUD|nr:HNH endonuclease [Pectobacterium phage vB_PatP_CB5]ARW59020.1 HNH endonuclease [Pectobacterium phage vB_PatP_CB5]
MALHDYLEIDLTLPSCLRWKAAPSKRVRAGAPAFTTLDIYGYMRGMFQRKHYQAHRVVFYLTHGYWAEQIDHIDGDRANNKPTNLRAVTQTQNQHNRVCRGYYFCNTTQKYVAQIKVDNVGRTIGSYSTPEDARRAYLQEKALLHPTAPTRCFEEVSLGI